MKTFIQKPSGTLDLRSRNGLHVSGQRAIARGGAGYPLSRRSGGIRDAKKEAILEPPELLTGELIEPDLRVNREKRMARINHVALKVVDLEAATRFYENVFGFRQVGTGRSRGHISRHLTDGYVDLALMVYDSEQDEEAKLVGPGPAIHHFGIEVDDHQGFAEKVVANGGTILSKPGEVPIKYRSPDGTVAEIVPQGRYEKMREKRG